MGCPALAPGISGLSLFLFTFLLIYATFIARFIVVRAPRRFRGQDLKMTTSSFAPLPSSVVLSARCSFAPWSGSALGVSFRPSVRSFSGFVAVVRFSSPAAAGLFSRSWARRLAPAVAFCTVRKGPLSLPPCWLVSVPVAPPPALVGRGRASRRLAECFAAACAAA